MAFARLADFFIAYAVLIVAVVLALGACAIGRPWLGAAALVAGVVAFLLACRAERALDAQSLDEIESQLME